MGPTSGKGKEMNIGSSHSSQIPTSKGCAAYSARRRGLLGRSDGADAQAKVETLGKDLLAGRVESLEPCSIRNSNADLEAITHTSQDPMAQLVSNWANNGEDLIIPISGMEETLIKGYGLAEVAKGAVVSQGRHGDEELAQFRILQPADGASNGPGVIAAHFDFPENHSLLDGTGFAASTAFHSLYFVSDVSRVKGVVGETRGDLQACGERLKSFLNSAQAEAPVELHHVKDGFARGPQDSIVNVGDTVLTPSRTAHFPHIVAAACTQGIKTVLNATVKEPAPAIPAPGLLPKGGLSGALIGGVIAAASATVAALAGATPAVAPALAAVGVLSGFSAGFFALRMRDPHDEYDSARPGSFEAFQKRKVGRLCAGASLGAFLPLTIGAGAIFGVPGVLAAVGIGAALGATVGK